MLFVLIIFRFRFIKKINEKKNNIIRNKKILIIYVNFKFLNINIKLYILF